MSAWHAQRRRRHTCARRASPAGADWWIAQERSVANRRGAGGRLCASMKRFREDETYEDLRREALAQADLFDGRPDRGPALQEHAPPDPDPDCACTD